MTVNSHTKKKRSQSSSRQNLQHNYLIELILISVALLSSALSSSVDLALIAGLRRKAVILLTLHELARET